MDEVSVIGLDLAKHVFQVHGADASGRVVLRKRLRRAQVPEFTMARCWRVPPESDHLPHRSGSDQDHNCVDV